MGKKKKFEGEYTTLFEERNPNIDKLVKLYKENRYNARVVFMNDSRENYVSSRLGLFTEKNGDFNLVYFKKSFGVNKNNVMYSNERREVTFTYKSGKFHKIVTRGSNKYVQQLTFNGLNTDMTHRMSTVVKVFFIEKFSWLRHMKENNVLLDVAFNTIVNKKLFSLKKAMSYHYKVPYPVAKAFHSNKGKSDITKYVRTYLPYIKNIENFNQEWMDDELFDIFYDTIKMGRVLNKQVNCSWSKKRLKSEHDKWSSEIADIVFTHDNREMNIGQIYKDFQKYSGYELLTETKEMAKEGMKQNHCVASYVSNVEYHNCAIFRVEGYTLEIRRKYSNEGYGLYKNQLRGFKNQNAPIEIQNRVEEKLKEFNDKIGAEIDWENTEDVIIPF